MQSLSDVQVGPGPIFECVRFSTLGRSPLLQHYLYTHNLTDVEVHTGIYLRIILILVSL